jgi:hypothetical protein
LSPSAKHLVGYAGLGASVHNSGKTHRTGRITKQGRRELRWVLVQAAWVAVNTQPHWKEQYQRLTRRKPTNKAIVVIARKLLVVVWHVLTECVADRKADEEMVAFNLLMWAWNLGKERRGGFSTPQLKCWLCKQKPSQYHNHLGVAGDNRIVIFLTPV